MSTSTTPQTSAVDPKPQKPKRGWVRPTIIGVVAFLVGVGVGGAGGSDGSTGTKAAKETVTETLTTTVEVGAEKPAGHEAEEEDSHTPSDSDNGSKTKFSNGTFLVNKDIAPGTYRSEGGSMCYWERRSDTSGELDGIIANDLQEGGGLVTIDASDVAFKTQGCGTWELVE